MLLRHKSIERILKNKPTRKIEYYCFGFTILKLEILLSTRSSNSISLRFCSDSRGIIMVVKLYVRMFEFRFTFWIILVMYYNLKTNFYII